MKQTPLTRKVPLPRSSSLTTRAGQLPRTRLNPVSKKRQRENRVRAKVVAEMRAAHPFCARCGARGVHLDAHELLSRARGGSIVDSTNIVLVCRPCHDHITTHPAEAEADGWALSRFGGAA